MTNGSDLRGIIFDKDGTLFDFNATWGAWAGTMIAAEAGGDTSLISALSYRLGYDYDAGRFQPGSIVIAETVDVVADAILDVLQKDNKPSLIQRMNAAAQQVPQAEAAPLIPFFETMRSLNMKLGVATNDTEGPARMHLARAGVVDMLDFVAGSDSGFGGKPAPGQLLAFCEAVGLAPEVCAMVGDSTHDLFAGQSAGMRTIGVLTGPALRAELEPHADVVLDSIADIPSWIAANRL